MSDAGSGMRRVPIEAQAVDAPLTSSAVFLTLTLSDVPDAAATVRGVLASIGDTVKSVGFRDLDAALACTAAIGAAAWQAVTGAPPPAELHPFAPVAGARHTAIATPGDLFLHIRSERRDLCFELERQLLDRFGGAVTVVDETVGFRSFDMRDLLGFVDGTEHAILRDNMPFGSPGAGEFGTYFIGYTRHLWVIERMLQRMFIGDPPGLHDRLLDFSTPMTGATFFAPSASFLDALG